MLLYDYFRSSCAYRVRIALNLKRVAYERVPVDLRANVQHGADYRAHNRQGLVPTLVADGIELTQSLAIIDWLDRAHPDPRLIPEAPAARARAWSQALAIACDIQPLNNLRVLRRLAAQFGIAEPDRDIWYRHWVAEGFAALEASAGEGPFLGGATPSIADVCLVPQMYNARRLETPLDPFPRLVAIDAALAALAPVAAAHPDRVAPDD